MAEIKSRHSNAYEPWTAEDDAELVSLHNQGKRSAELAAVFQRQPSAIGSRLRKLNLVPGNSSE